MYIHLSSLERNILEEKNIDNPPVLNRGFCLHIDCFNDILKNRRVIRMKYVKKYWFIILIVVVSLLRFFFTYKLPSYYIGGLHYDDRLMIQQMGQLLDNHYLGDYNSHTLIKGMIFPLVLFYSRLLYLRYSTFLTILYILASLYFVFALKELIKNKKILLVFYVVLLFNPVTYSGELFQRLYINSISITELLFFLGSLLFVVFTEKDEPIYYVILGTVSSIMLLTRNDNLWIYIVLIILILYKLYKYHLFKRFFISKKFYTTLIPFIVITLGFQIVSYINYKHYGVYTYNELENSAFKDAYRKVTQIKNKKKDKVSITKNMFYQLCDQTKSFGYERKNIDYYYNHVKLKDGEIDNGNIIWHFRSLIYDKYHFKSGKEANDYFKKFDKELDSLFQSKKLEKKNSSLPSVFLNIPSKNELLHIPGYMIKAITYTSSYQNVRTFSKNELKKMEKTTYDEDNKAYNIFYSNYRYSENMIKKNLLICEIIRNIYKYLTIVFSIISLIFYFKNIKKKDKLNFILHVIFFIYLIILGGVVYTHATAFHAIRYRYLSNIYILQNIFILLNLYRWLDNKKNKKEGTKDDIDNHTSIQRRRNNQKNIKGNRKSSKKTQPQKRIRSNHSK